jgi:hypothetical protein
VAISLKDSVSDEAAKTLSVTGADDDAVVAEGVELLPAVDVDPPQATNSVQSKKSGKIARNKCFKTNLLQWEAHNTLHEIPQL